MPRLDLDFTDQARIDLLEIEIYSELLWGDMHATSYLDDISRSIQILLRHPESGSLYDDETFGVRTKVSREHQIHYLVRDNSLIILNVQGPGKELTRNDLERLIPGI